MMCSTRSRPHLTRPVGRTGGLRLAGSGIFPSQTTREGASHATDTFGVTKLLPGIHGLS